MSIVSYWGLLEISIKAAEVNYKIEDFRQLSLRISAQLDVLRMLFTISQTPSHPSGVGNYSLIILG